MVSSPPLKTEEEKVIKTTTLPVLPTTDCIAQGGQVLSETFFSSNLETDFHNYLYLPPCYETSAMEGYPVLYLLHGLSQTHEEWLQMGLAEEMNTLIAKNEIPPFIIVLPLEATFNPPQTSPFPDAIIEELIPRIDDLYNTRSEKEYRAIGGISRGAAWAVRMGFKFYKTFSKVGAHSLPLFKADGSNVLVWVTQTPADELPEFFIDIGRDDQNWKTAQEFTNLLNAYDIPHEWYFFTGGHTEQYWASHLVQYLQWYANGW